MGKKKEIQIAIVGLGKIGSTFLKKLLEKERHGIKLMGVVEQNKDTPGIEFAKTKGIKIYDNLDKLLYLSQEVDVIFDLTGNIGAREAMRGGLARTRNQHTVIAPEVIAFLIWDLIAQGSEEFPAHTSPQSGAKRGY